MVNVKYKDLDYLSSDCSPVVMTMASQAFDPGSNPGSRTISALFFKKNKIN